MARSIVFAMMIAAVSAPFPNVPAFAESAGSQRADTQAICLDRQQRAGLSQAEYRACVDQQNRRTTRHVSALACTGETCQLRLRRMEIGLYDGGAFALRLAFDASRSAVRSSLTDRQGRRADLIQSCGASGCPGAPEWIAGAFHGATYTPIGDPTAPEAVILRLPRAAMH